jgi:hypothetical protein
MNENPIDLTKLHGVSLFAIQPGTKHGEDYHILVNGFGKKQTGVHKVTVPLTDVEKNLPIGQRPRGPSVRESQYMLSEYFPRHAFWIAGGNKPTASVLLPHPLVGFIVYVYGCEKFTELEPGLRNFHLSYARRYIKSGSLFLYFRMNKDMLLFDFEHHGITMVPVHDVCGDEAAWSALQGNPLRYYFEDVLINECCYNDYEVIHKLIGDFLERIDPADKG